MAKKLRQVSVGMTNAGNPRLRWVIECDCGSSLTCANFTNTCRCGTDYNSFGQQLAPREQWGEETGKNLSDILRADVDPDGDEYQPW